MRGRLPSLKPTVFIRKLQRAGFVVDHQTGSHVILVNESGIRLSVPVHAREMKRGLMMGLIKQAGLELEKFRGL